MTPDLQTQLNEALNELERYQEFGTPEELTLTFDLIEQYLKAHTLATTITEDDEYDIL